MNTIRSASNPHLKRVRAVGAGREPGTLLLEGDRLVEEALRAELEIELCLVSDRRLDRMPLIRTDTAKTFAVEDSLLCRLSKLESPPGILTLTKSPENVSIESMRLDANALVLVIAGVQDPGNLGALARTAEAAGADGLVISTEGCSPWNEKAMRGSMGSLLRLPVSRVDDVEDASRRLTSSGFRSVRAATAGGGVYDAFDWSGPVALWVSSETGRWPRALEASSTEFEEVSIPMAPGVDSLNVSAAAAVLLFATGRTSEGTS